MKRRTVLAGATILAVVGVLAVGVITKPGSASAQSFSIVSAGDTSTCALTASAGAVKCWGRNIEGQLGIGTTAAPYGQSNVPLPVCAGGTWNGTSCSGGSAFTGAYGLSVGPVADHSCALIVYLIVECWGANDHGQAGNDTDLVVLHPAVITCAGASGSYCNSTLHILAGIVAVAAGTQHTCALDYSGYVWCWGDNTKGQLGDGTAAGRIVAKRVCATGSGEDCTNGTLLSGVTAIATGQDFNCALTSSGGMKCWGWNRYGQLGDGTTTNRSLPVDVLGLTSGVASTSTGQIHTCAVLSDTYHHVKCWGNNRYGMLGDGTQVNRTTPASVCAIGGCGNGTLSGASSLTAGVAHTCVIAGASTVLCWGSQAYGQLGNSTQDYHAVQTSPVGWTAPSWHPTPTPPLTPQATALSAGGAHTCAIISTYAECWGWNYFGQLGNNGTQEYTTTWTGQDTDKDGCTDYQELGPDHTKGGHRDPTNFWDFFDTPDTANTTLSSAIHPSAVPPFDITVITTNGFPASNDSFYIDNEKFSWDTKTTSSPYRFHITGRALDGTLAAQHNSGAYVVRNIRDRKVDSADYNRISARYGSDGDATIDPLSAPAPSGYHPAFDRQDDPNSSEAWDLIGPDGHIRVADLLNLSAQLNDSCQ